jgi:nucleoside-diphosphate-sugar epimerase
VRIADAFRDLAEALEVPYQPMNVAPEDMPRFQSALYRQYPENLLLRILFEDYFLCSADKWYKATGYQPRFGYREGLSRTVRWYREQGLL